jgi:hypothetical protein
MLLYLTNNAPDTVDILEVESMDISGLKLGDDVIRLDFYEKPDHGQDPEATYYIGVDPEIFHISELAARCPDQAHLAQEYQRFNVSHVAKIAWSYKENGRDYNGYIVPAVCDRIFVVNRKTMAILPSPDQRDLSARSA